MLKMVINAKYLGQDEDVAKLISTIHFLGDETISKWAQVSKIPERRVRYIIQKLTDDKLISRRIALNISNTGYIRFVFRMQATFGSMEDKVEWFNFTKSFTEVSTLYELSGNETLALIIYAESALEALNVIDRLTSHKSIKIINTSLTERVRNRFLRNRLFYRSNLKPIALSEDISSPNCLIDQLDFKILGALALPGFFHYTDMARHINIPYQTFINRVRMLYEKKVIIGQLIQLDSQMLGYCTFLVCLNLRRKVYQIDEITKILYEKTNGVTSVLETLGMTQYEFILDLKHAKELTDYISLLQMIFKDDLVGISSMQILQYHKHAQGSFLKMR